MKLWKYHSDSRSQSRSWWPPCKAASVALKNNFRAVNFIFISVFNFSHIAVRTHLLRSEKNGQIAQKCIDFSHEIIFPEHLVLFVLVRSDVFVSLLRMQRPVMLLFYDPMLLVSGLAVKRMMPIHWLLKCCSLQYQGAKQNNGIVKTAAVLEEGKSSSCSEELDQTGVLPLLVFSHNNLILADPAIYMAHLMLQMQVTCLRQTYRIRWGHDMNRATISPGIPLQCPSICV